MRDRIYTSWLVRQYDEAMRLASDTDLVQLLPLEPAGRPPDRYIAHFECVGLVRDQSSEVREQAGAEVGIWFPRDYLRRAEPFQVVTWLGPSNAFHPNIRPPFICIGRLTAGTSLVDILYQCFEIIVYRNWAAHDGLNPEACQWVRNNQHRLPIDRRPLKRRKLHGGIQVTNTGQQL
jgi:hypothetical protein